MAWTPVRDSRRHPVRWNEGQIDRLAAQISAVERAIARNQSGDEQANLSGRAKTSA
jgi:hypothetical protein